MRSLAPLSRVDAILAVVHADDADFEKKVKRGKPGSGKGGQFVAKEGGDGGAAAAAEPTDKPAEQPAEKPATAARARRAPKTKTEAPATPSKPAARKPAAPKAPKEPKPPKAAPKPRAKAKKPQTREEYESAIEDLISQYEAAHGTWGGPRKSGRMQQVTTAAGRKIDVRPKVVDLADLVTSDDPRFPQELQPRQRGQRAALSEQVRNIARTLDPSRMGESAEADRGAPITGDGGVVESGNGRVMALREVYASHPEKAQEYRAYLESQGYKTEGMKQPVLIRERATPMDMEERRKFTVEANQSSTAALSALERAQADGKMIDAAMIDRLQPGDLSSGANADFAKAFIAKVPEGERNAMQAKDGKLSSEGVRRIQNAILSKAYGGSDEATAVMGRMMESTDEDMRSAMGAMLDAAREMATLRQTVADGNLDPKYDIASALPKALERVKMIREAGQNVNEALGQEDAFSARDPLSDALVRALYNPSGKRLLGRDKLTATLKNYAKAAENERSNQGGMFDPIPPERLVSMSRPAEPEGPEASETFALRGQGPPGRSGMTATVHSDSWGRKATLLEVLLKLSVEL